MPEHIQYDDHDLFNAETHHESSDVPVKGLLWFIVIFIVFSVITWAIVLFMYKGFAKMERFATGLTRISRGGGCRRVGRRGHAGARPAARSL